MVTVCTVTVHVHQVVNANHFTISAELKNTCTPKEATTSCTQIRVSPILYLPSPPTHTHYISFTTPPSTLLIQEPSSHLPYMTPVVTCLPVSSCQYLCLPSRRLTAPSLPHLYVLIGSETAVTIHRPRTTHGHTEYMTK